MRPKPLILVVDDDAPILTLMRNVLREFGFESETALTGESAIEAAQQRKPDLVLLDKNMPGMTGQDVIRAIRSRSGLEHVPIVILSGEPVDHAELSSIGANGAVQKPFDIPELIETIRTAVAVGSNKL
jgi:two-component system phosphate regulon response regulator PhoB